MNKNDSTHWIGSWATTPDPLEGISVAGQTFRIISYISMGGSGVRVRISNAYGTQTLRIGAASVGLRSRGADLAPGSNHALSFNGLPFTRIPVGTFAVSDPVDWEVKALEELAISVYVPDFLPETFRLTGHDNGHQTNYVSGPGNFSASENFPVQRTLESFVLVTGVDVSVPDGTGSIVAFGDSLTEGNISQLDANNRWPDQLARRLVARSDGRSLSVLNQGLGGNRMLHDGRGDNALRRFDRDVIAQPGVTHAIVLLGINDLRNSSGDQDEIVTAEQLIAGMQQMITRARTSRIRIFGGTLLPWRNETFKGGFYSAVGEEKRQVLNTWIRTANAFDDVIDFEAALRDPDDPGQILPRWDSGDHLHPSDAGYRQMADGIDLALFR